MISLRSLEISSLLSLLGSTAVEQNRMREGAMAKCRTPGHGRTNAIVVVLPQLLAVDICRLHVLCLGVGQSPRQLLECTRDMFVVRFLN